MHYSYALSMRITIPLRVTMPCLRLAFHVRTGTTTPLKEFPPLRYQPAASRHGPASSIGNRIWRAGRSATSSPKLYLASIQVFERVQTQIAQEYLRQNLDFLLASVNLLQDLLSNPPHHTHSQIKPTLKKLSRESTLPQAAQSLKLGKAGSWLKRYGVDPRFPANLRHMK